MSRRASHKKLLDAVKPDEASGQRHSRRANANGSSRPALVVVKTSDLLAAAVRGLRDGALSEMVAQLSEDRLFRNELEKLRELERTHRQPGVDLRRFLNRPIQHPFLREWMELSEEALDERSGRVDLRRRRRHGVLRMLDGDERANPFDIPSLALVPTAPEIEIRVFELFDEAEYYVLAFRPSKHPAVPMRPVREVLHHRDLRALLGVRASTLDSWLSLWPQMIGGLRMIPFGERRPTNRKVPRRPRETSRRVTADTMAFMVWLHSTQN